MAATRKIWVRRAPNGSPTLIKISEDDLVDDMREVILRKFANSLGRQYDAPDLTIHIVNREPQAPKKSAMASTAAWRNKLQQQQEPQPPKRRALGPEEQVAKTLDKHYPGGQTVNEALVIEVVAPMFGPPSFATTVPSAHSSVAPLTPLREHAAGTVSVPNYGFATDCIHFDPHGSTNPSTAAMSAATAPRTGRKASGGGNGGGGGSGGVVGACGPGGCGNSISAGGGSSSSGNGGGGGSSRSPALLSPNALTAHYDYHHHFPHPGMTSTTTTTTTVSAAPAEPTGYFDLPTSRAIPIASTQSMALLLPAGARAHPERPNHLFRAQTTVLPISVATDTTTKELNNHDGTVASVGVGAGAASIPSAVSTRLPIATATATAAAATTTTNSNSMVAAAKAKPRSEAAVSDRASVSPAGKTAPHTPLALPMLGLGPAPDLGNSVDGLDGVKSDGATASASMSSAPVASSGVNGEQTAPVAPLAASLSSSLVVDANGTPVAITAEPKMRPGTRNKRHVTDDELPSSIVAPISKLKEVMPPINVLIVEDNIINLKLLEAFARRLKVRWETATDGKKAVDKWREGGFHLVLMDIQLPIMTGLEATREIRRLEKVNGVGAFKIAPKSKGGPGDEQNPNDILAVGAGFKSPVIIVALTASSLQSDRHEALAAGCNDFLTKPVNFLFLERKVKEWGCMQALIDYDGWKQWKHMSAERLQEEAARRQAAALAKAAKKNQKQMLDPTPETSAKVEVGA